MASHEKSRKWNIDKDTHKENRQTYIALAAHWIQYINCNGCWMVIIVRWNPLCLCLCYWFVEIEKTTTRQWRQQNDIKYLQISRWFFYYGAFIWFCIILALYLYTFRLSLCRWHCHCRFNIILSHTIQQPQQQQQKTNFKLVNRHVRLFEINLFAICYKNILSVEFRMQRANEREWFIENHVSGRQKIPNKIPQRADWDCDIFTLLLWITIEFPYRETKTFYLACIPHISSIK